MFEGVFPRVSPNGKLIAHIDKKSIILRKISSYEIQAVFNVEGNVGWVDWSPDSENIVFSIEKSMHRNEVHIINISSKKITKILTTGILKDLNWIKNKVDWNLYRWKVSSPK